MRRLFLWKAHLKYWSGTTITPTPTRLPARSWCCQSRRKTWVLYLGSPWGTSWRTWDFKCPWQLHWTTCNFSLPLAGGRTVFDWPRRTKSRRSNQHVHKAPLLIDVWYSHPWPWCYLSPRAATLIPALTCVFGSATTQHHPIQQAHRTLMTWLADADSTTIHGA